MGFPIPPGVAHGDCRAILGLVDEAQRTASWLRGPVTVTSRLFLRHRHDIILALR